MAPMHVKNSREVPEYEIDPKELDFTDSVEISAKVIQASFGYCICSILDNVVPLLNTA